MILADKRPPIQYNTKMGKRKNANGTQKQALKKKKQDKKEDKNEELFNCTVCFEDVNKADLLNHKHVKHGTISFLCHECGEIFKISHYKKHTDTTVHHRCPSGQVSGGEITDFCCPVCELVCSSKADLTSHLKFHCTKVVPRRQKVKQHVDYEDHGTVASEEKPSYICWVCEMICTDPNDLQSHLNQHDSSEIDSKLTNPVDDTIFCDKCGVNVDKCDLESHEQKCSEEISLHVKANDDCKTINEKYYECAYCGELFVSDQIRDFHSQTQCRERPRSSLPVDQFWHKCKSCKLAFREEEHLKDHAERVHRFGFSPLKNLLIEKTGKSVHSSAKDSSLGKMGKNDNLSSKDSSLEKVEKSEEPAEKIVLTGCSECRLVFNGVQQMREHKRLVHWRYKCPQCDAKFLSANELSHHRQNTLLHNKDGHIAQGKKETHRTKKVQGIVNDFEQFGVLKDSVQEFTIEQRSDDRQVQIVHNVLHNAQIPLYHENQGSRSSGFVKLENDNVQFDGVSAVKLENVHFDEEGNVKLENVQFGSVGTVAIGEFDHYNNVQFHGVNTAGSLPPGTFLSGKNDLVYNGIQIKNEPDVYCTEETSPFAHLEIKDEERNSMMNQCNYPDQ